MRVLKGKYKELKNDQPMALAIGNFDGVHIGHQSLINEILSSDSNYTKGVMSFSPHTMQYFTKNNFKTIHTINDKVEELLKYPIDKVILVEFDADFSNLEVFEMIEFLKGLNVKKVVVGSDFRFGKKGLGKPSDLEKDFELTVVKDVYYGDMMVSSTLVKDYINYGQLDLVRKILNHDYLISATVISGNQVGRTIGFPTANLDYDGVLLPPNGVYYVKVHYNNKKYLGMANIGYNPTINFTEGKKLEVHILDFDEMIYGKTVKIEFIKWLRAETKFNSKADLINQLEKDKKDIIKLSKTY